MTIDERDLVSFTGWRRGKNTVAAETTLRKDALREALNVDIDRDGKVRRRLGYVSRYAGTNIHSLWSDGAQTLFVENGALKRLNPNYWATTLRTGLDPQRLLSYVAINGEVYYSNAAQTGKVTAASVAAPWGVKEPAGQPLVSAVANGSLTVGRYQVAIAYVSSTGELSGASLASTITVTEGQGLQLTSIPQPSEAHVTHTRVFVTDTNGDILYRQVDVPLGVTSYVITKTLKTEPLDTQFMTVPPAGHLVRHYNGRLYIAIGNVVFYTEALRYGLCKLSENFLLFPERVTVFEPVLDGIYVATDSTYFLSGDEPAKFQQFVASPYTAVEGTGLQLDSNVFKLQNVDGKVAYWFGERGAMLGLSGGKVLPVMETQVAVSQYNAGVSLFRETDGIRQMVTALRGKGDVASFMAGDSVTAIVERHGIVI